MGFFDSIGDLFGSVSGGLEQVAGFLGDVNDIKSAFEGVKGKAGAVAYQAGQVVGQPVNLEDLLGITHVAPTTVAPHFHPHVPGTPKHKHPHLTPGGWMSGSPPGKGNGKAAGGGGAALAIAGVVAAALLLR